jgi:hypothetical protein
MEAIKNAIKMIHEHKGEFNELEKYARNKFSEYDKNQRHPHFIWTGYNGYEVINEKTLKIKIIFGVVESNIENHEYIYIDVETGRIFEEEQYGEMLKSKEQKIKTHKVVDLVYHQDEGNEVFVGTYEECHEWVSGQGFGYGVQPLTKEEIIAVNDAYKK